MSYVANVMVSVDYDDTAAVTGFSDWLRDKPGGTGWGYLSPITGRDSQWGGWKFPECEVWAGTLNHADLDVVVDHFGRIEWRQPNAVQLFLMNQDEWFFRLWMFRDGALRQYAPTKPDEGDPDFHPPEDR